MDTERTPEAGVDDFAGLLRHHIASTGVAKAALARAIGTKPQYIREIETGRKPPPTLEKVEILADELGLDVAARDRFLARAREGRTKPESRAYFRNMEEAIQELSDLFGIDTDAREHLRKGDFDPMLEQIRAAFNSAGKVDDPEAFLPFLKVMRYRRFVLDMVAGFDRLNEERRTDDLAWLQDAMLEHMERLMGLREGEQRMSEKLSEKRSETRSESSDRQD